MLALGVFLGRLSLRHSSPAMVVLAAPAPSPAASAAALVLDLNRASAEELTALTGIGPQLAQRIVDYRLENGPFQYPYELMNVPGIAEKKYEGLREQITVTPQERMESP